MPEQNQIYDPESGQWVAAPTWTSDEPEFVDTEPDPNPSFESITAVTSCPELGKRHKFKNRATGEMSETCLVCGNPRSTPTPRSTASSSTEPRTRTRGGKTNTLDTILSGIWYAAGAGVRQLVPAPSGAVTGRVIQLEAAIAGPKLHKALKRTPLYPYIALAESQIGWAAEIGMLLAPPILLGLAAARPDIARTMKPMLVGILTPVLAEVAKKAKEQTALLELLETYDAEVIEAASSIIDDLIGIEPTEDWSSQEQEPEPANA